MFEESLSGLDVLAVADDATLIDAITGWAAAEATAAARRLAAIAELTERRCGSELARQRAHWACDAWDSAAAEIAAAQAISHRAATTLMHQGLALRHRLPQVGALLATGAISARMATTLTWRTHLVDDTEVLAAIDAELAAVITTWERLSAAKLEAAADGLIDRHDPAAVLAHRTAVRSRDVRVGTQDDDAGTCSLWGRLLATDGELLTRRLDAMATSVCRADPRRLGERRSDALGVLMAGGEQLPCRCEHPDCPHTGTDARAEAIVIHVLTNQHPDHPTGPSAPSPTGPDPQPAGTTATPDTGARSCGPTTAVIAGGPAIPAPLLAELARIGALTHLVPDPAALGAEPGYRPSALLARFVRSRDLTCCFTGCDRPAEYCDLDHSIAYATSRLTHPGNVKCLCRKHHLLKTFWTDWRDEQLADGTIIWTAPTGHQYRTPPGSRLHFPDWNTTTPVPPTPLPTGPSPTREVHPPDRGLAMPLRRRTRTQDRDRRIQAERDYNAAVIAGEEPPPF